MQDDVPNQPDLVYSPTATKHPNELETVALFFLALISILNALTVPFAIAESDELNTSASGIIYGIVLFLEFFLTPSLWYIISKPRNGIYWIPLTLLWFAVTWKFYLANVPLFEIFAFITDPFALFLFPYYFCIFGSLLSTFLLVISWLRERQRVSSVMDP